MPRKYVTISKKKEHAENWYFERFETLDTRTVSEIEGSFRKAFCFKLFNVYSTIYQNTDVGVVPLLYAVSGVGGVHMQ